MRTKLILMAAAAMLAAGTAHAATRAWAPPRLGDGHPDLNGVWSNASVTGLTRPPSVAKLVVDEKEAAKLAKDNPFVKLIEAENGPSDIKNDRLLEDGNSDRGYNTFWVDPGKSLARVNGEYRTSWIVEPASGQMPLTDEGRKRIQSLRQARMQTLYHGPENLPLPERCLIGFTGAGGPGMLNTIYNNNYQIVQTPTSVVIVVEMVHDARTIPIGKDKAAAQAMHRPTAVSAWLGDSVGWWEGDTLVVETVNVNREEGQSGPIFLSDKAKVTERFTRTSPTQITYGFTVEDPVYYSTTWRAEESLNARKERVYEYACHEGNYAMTGILGGARALEAKGETPTLGPGIFGTPIPERKAPAGGGGE